MFVLTPAMKAAAAASTPTEREQMRALTLKHLIAAGAVPAPTNLLRSKSTDEGNDR